MLGECHLDSSGTGQVPVQGSCKYGMEL